MKLDDLLKILKLKKKENSDEVEFDEAADNNAENEVKDTLKEAVPVLEKEKKIEEKEVKSMGIPKYDTKTGLFDLSGIDDAALKEVLKLANDTVRANANSALVEKALSAKLDTINVANGISKDILIKLIDKSNIKVSDGTVSGIDEAFEALKKDNAGLFALEKKESSPILEGFNPVQSSNTGKIPNSFAEALAMEQGNI